MTDTNLGKINYLNLKVAYGAKSITCDKIRECLGKYKQDIRNEIFYSLQVQPIISKKIILKPLKNCLQMTSINL